MALLTNYQDFLDRVDELGFMSLSALGSVLPMLSQETSGAAWHTGDPETDPWQWKDRAAHEKRLAYGCLIGGHKGFVSARMYPLFVVAYQPLEWMEERWISGIISQTTWELWQLFEKKTTLDTSEIRREIGVTAKSGGSRVDASARDLQREFYITVSGNRRKLDRHGRPYGWPACVYETVTSWAPPEWLASVDSLNQAQARERILDAAEVIGKGLRREDFASVLRLPAARL